MRNNNRRGIGAYHKKPGWEVVGALLGPVVMAMCAERAAMGQCATAPGPGFPLEPRVGAEAVNLNGTIIVLGGRPWDGTGASVSYLTPGATTWLPGFPMTDYVMHPAVGIDAFGRIMLVGGYITEDHPPYFLPVVTGAYYDLASGQGAAIPPYPNARAFYAHAVDDQHRLYLIGGLDTARNATRFVERFDAVSGSWEQLAPLPGARDHATAAYDGRGHIFVTGGFNSNGVIVASSFSYDIAGNTWSPAPAQPSPLADQAAILAGNGLIYVLGGATLSTHVRAVYVYDPVAGTWCNGPPLVTGRSGEAIAIGDDGFVYAIGGYHGTLGTNTVEKLFVSPAPGGDCDDNGIPDACDLAGKCNLDCNDNSILDVCDLAAGTEPDVNTNGVPDVCDECIVNADCDDALACTDNLCQAGSCTFEPNNANCPDDGQFCNGVEVCTLLQGCVSAGNPCGTNEICMAAAGACWMMGDGNGDGTIDLADYLVFHDCLEGSMNDPNASCTTLDFDRDGDFDLADFGVFQGLFPAG